MTKPITPQTASESDSSTDKHSKSRNSLESLDSFAILGEDGPFMDAIEGFQPRPVQQELAKTIDHTLKTKTSLVAEAGTGIGKTFAYLVPAVSSKKSIIVSTGTRNLQDQLYHKDLPKVCKTLGIKSRLALLKGRNNYLCIHRMDMAIADGRMSSRQASHDLQLANRWSSETRTGDLAELVNLADDSEIRSYITSNADNCLGQDCPSYDECHVLAARKKAQQADIVVINHHLLCADLALREEGFADLLPEAEMIIVDEAHKLPDVVTQFFGKSVSSRQMLELASDMRAEYLTEAKDCRELDDSANAIEQRIKEFRLALGEESQRLAWDRFKSKKAVIENIVELTALLEELVQTLEALSTRSRGLESCHKRCQFLLSAFVDLTDDVTSDTVHWCETWQRSFQIHQTPVNISKTFREQWQNHGGSWIFTSATLAIDGDLKHYQNEMGLTEARTLLLNSPFNYSEQALMYLPKGLPEPSSAEHPIELMKAVLPVLRASKGRAFCLFTSYRALQTAASWLSENGQFKILIQGTADKTELLKRFTENDSAVLMATASFWEGVDVRGDNLCCVVIDKLPFAVPSDPVIQARISACKKNGEDAFAKLQLPQAVISLKQGAGRLIRDQTDRGVLVLGDPRLVSKKYGGAFINSLPAMHKTRDLELVKGFLGEID
ncbi:MAG: ATP-dependent DNA helicase DinG [Enterobacterales bacterium]|jgi:ATP-dependent DNA helicase DinG